MKVTKRTATTRSSFGVGSISPWIVLSSLITFVILCSFVLSLQLWTSGPKIQAKVGSVGPIGPVGPPGSCNLSSTNQTFVAVGIEVNGNISMNGSVTFGNGSIFFNSTDQCVQIEPKLCVKEIGNGGEPITILSPTVFLGSVITTIVQFGPNISLVYDSLTNTLQLIGGLLDANLVGSPINVGNSGYLTNVSNLEMLIFANNVFTVNATLARFNTFVEFLDAIVSFTNFWNSISIGSSFSIFFGNSSTVNGTIPSIGTDIGTPSNLTITGADYNVVVKSLVSIILEGLTKFYGNVSLNGNVISDLFLDKKIIFNNNGAQIYATGSCLVLQAPSLCFNATTSFAFGTPVSFLLPITGNTTINGGLTINGTLNILGSFLVVNLTVSNTINTTNIIAKNIQATQTLSTTNGSQVSFSGAFTVEATGSSNFNGPVKFLNGNVSSITCSQPYFDNSASGCVSLCVNHSTCNDHLNSLQVTNNVQVQGNIVRTGISNPHPCCTGSGNFNYLFQRWSHNTTSTTTANVTTNSTFIPLNFTSNDFIGLANGNVLIGFTGSFNWVVATTGIYNLIVSVEIDTTSSANIDIMILCLSTGNSTRVFTSPTFKGIARTTPFTQTSFTSVSTTIFTHQFLTGLTALDTCNFYLYAHGGVITISSGNKYTLGIKLENYN